MFNYKVSINGGIKQHYKSQNLDKLHEVIVPLLTKEGDKAEIFYEKERVSTVTKKADAYHWKHNGYFFHSKG